MSGWLMGLGLGLAALMVSKAYPLILVICKWSR